MDEHFDSLLLAFLRDPASYPHHPRELRELHTHGSLVFVVPPLVYKIKKPVDLGFLDFSTLEKRRHFCEREVELNSRLAPGVYLGVESITREDDGFAFGGSGPVVEWAVKMECLPAGGFLDARIKAGTAGEAELERVAQTLAAFYQKQRQTPEIATWGTIAKLRVSTDENFAQTEEFVGKTLSRTAFEAIRSFTNACYERRRERFERRVPEGWIRDCHGDLHLDHVHVTDDELHIHDCIEFNDRFRYVDVANDVAFLAMLLVIAFAIVRLNNLFAVVMLTGVYSLVSAVWLLVLDAVDVSFTEAAVGAGVSTVLMLGAMLLTAREAKPVSASRQANRQGPTSRAPPPMHRV